MPITVKTDILPPIHARESPQDLLEEAQHVLQEFRLQVAHDFDKASGLFKSAKWIQGAMLANEKESKALRLVHDNIIEQADESYLRIEEAHNQVLRVQDKLLKEAHRPPRPMLSRVTPWSLREAYEHTLKDSFEDAHQEYRKLCGFPDGLLTRIRLYRVHHEHMLPLEHHHDNLHVRFVEDYS
jgi:hypothetical protein